MAIAVAGCKDKAIKRLAEIYAEQVQLNGGIEIAERKTKIAIVHEQLAHLELVEEALVERDGGLRRIQSDPLAILGVRVAKKTKPRLAIVA